MSFHSWLDFVVVRVRSLFIAHLSPREMLRVILSYGGRVSIRYCESGGQVLPLIIGLNDHQLHDCQGRVQVSFSTLSNEALREVLPLLALLRNLDSVQLGEVVISLPQCRKLVAATLSRR